jgi:predicted nucleic acid-binding protein
MLILDTDALSLIQRGSGARFQKLLMRLDDADDDVFVTVISLDERVHGALKEIAANDPRLRIRGYRRLRELTTD